jgi:hypothetical protein
MSTHADKTLCPFGDGRAAAALYYKVLDAFPMPWSFPSGCMPICEIFV